MSDNLPVVVRQRLAELDQLIAKGEEEIARRAQQAFQLALYQSERFAMRMVIEAYEKRDVVTDKRPAQHLGMKPGDSGLAELGAGSLSAPATQTISNRIVEALGDGTSRTAKELLALIPGTTLSNIHATLSVLKKKAAVRHYPKTAKWARA